MSAVRNILSSRAGQTKTIWRSATKGFWNTALIYCKVELYLLDSGVSLLSQAKFTPLFLFPIQFVPRITNNGLWPPILLSEFYDFAPKHIRYTILKMLNFRSENSYITVTSEVACKTLGIWLQFSDYCSDVLAPLTG